MSGEFVHWMRLRKSSFFPRHQICWTQQCILRKMECITNRCDRWNHNCDNDLVVKHQFVTTTNNATLTEWHEWMRTTTSKNDDVFVCHGGKENKCDVFVERKKFALILRQSAANFCLRVPFFLQWEVHYSPSSFINKVAASHQMNNLRMKQTSHQTSI